MDWLLIALSGGGLMAAALAFVVWRLVREYAKKKVMEYEIENFKAELAKHKAAAKISASPKPDTWDGTVDRL